MVGTPRLSRSSLLYTTLHTPQQLWDEGRARGLPESGWLLVVDVPAQRLEAWHERRRVASYPVSTSRVGTGAVRGSCRTPTGWHELADRVGADAQPGQVFESRLPIEEILDESAWTSTGDEDRILSRILRLRGLEAGVNHGGDVDTYDRFIYIHGTNQEHLLGTPASHGCIRMGNLDVIELFDQLNGHPAWCWIGDLTPP